MVFFHPVYCTVLIIAKASMSGVYSALACRRGHVFNTEQGIGNLVTMKAYLPVAESFKFTESLRFVASATLAPTLLTQPFQSGDRR